MLVVMVLQVTSRNARFQQWEALLTNRTKRQRTGEFIVQGVRPVTLAVEHGWPVRTLIYGTGRPLSRWATGIVSDTGAERVAMAPELLAELGEKDEAAPEVLAVVALPPDDLGRIPLSRDLLAVAFDRPTSPGNIGTVVRSADAFGAHGVVVTGHGADPYDPKAVRASTGSLFAVPVVREGGHSGVTGWAWDSGLNVTIVGTDENGEADITDVDLTGPVLLVIGNETSGLSAGWRRACDVVARIPIAGAASSLNAASAAAVALYETARQRRASVSGTGRPTAAAPVPLPPA